MIDGYSADQVRAAEAPSLDAGVPLMARAAAGLAKEVRTLLPEDGGVILLLAGAGNNGGDALYAGAELAGDGANVAILPTAATTHPAALAAALEAGGHVVAAADAAAVAAVADVVIDGILGTGTGADAALRGTARDIVEMILPVLMGNDHAYVVAVDIPSGVHPDDGSVPDPLVLPADVTVTFGARKAGLLIAPGSEFAGEVRLVDIGIGDAFTGVKPTVRIEEAPTE